MIVIQISAIIKTKDSSFIVDKTLFDWIAISLSIEVIFRDRLPALSNLKIYSFKFEDYVEYRYI